jgi:ubiquinone/menaquinone biosynthesis C-methylase UbiE
MVIKNIYKFIIIILVLYICYFFYNLRNSYNLQNNSIESFIDYNQDDDIFDREYVDMYDVAYNDFNDIKMDYKHMLDANIFNNNDKIAILGCGVGKWGSYINSNRKNLDDLINIDKSTNMCRKAQKNYPNLKYINGNVVSNNNILNKNSQNIIIIDERMMLYNNFNDQTQIIINCHEWLKKDGYLVVPIYKIDSLGVACRFYSTNYIDDIGKLHGYTYLNGFTHDCWYEINQDSYKNNLDYYEKIVVDNNEKNNKRVFKQPMYIMKDNTLYDIILKSGFTVHKIYDTEKRVVSGYQLAIFKKGKTEITI